MKDGDTDDVSPIADALRAEAFELRWRACTAGGPKKKWRMSPVLRERLCTGGLVALLVFFLAVAAWFGGWCGQLP